MTILSEIDTHSPSKLWGKAYSFYKNKLGLRIFISQLATGSIYILSPTFSDLYIDPFIFQVLPEMDHTIFPGFLKGGFADRVVLNDVHFTRQLFRKLMKFLSISKCVVKVFKSNIFESYLVLGFFGNNRGGHQIKIPRNWFH